MKKSGFLTTVAGTILLGSAVSVQADGFRNPPEGAAVLGRGGARLTFADDPSVITHNPANLMDVEAPMVMPALTLGYRSATHTSPQGRTEKTRDPWRALPSLHVALPGQNGRFAWGAGLHFPYGQATKWDRDGAFRFGAPYRAEMTTLNFSPALATRLTDSLQAGLGVNILWSQLEFRQQFPWQPMPAGRTGPASDLRFEGDGWGVGARIGLAWQASERQRVALTYQSPSDIVYKGDFSIRNPPDNGGDMGGPLASDFETKLKFPSVVALGYGVSLTDALRLEAYGEWVEHSRNDRMDIDIGANNELLRAATGSTAIPQNWDDVWVFGIGGDWQAAPGLTLRAGWTYLPTPVPDETFMPTLPEGDKNIFSLGLGVGGTKHFLDVAYAWNVERDRRIEDHANPAVHGKYEFNTHLIGVSYQYSW